jgi:hypothetical protein
MLYSTNRKLAAYLVFDKCRVPECSPCICPSVAFAAKRYQILKRQVILVVVNMMNTLGVFATNCATVTITLSNGIPQLVIPGCGVF